MSDYHDDYLDDEYLDNGEEYLDECEDGNLIIKLLTNKDYLNTKINFNGTESLVL